jgi:hypothetical protein
VPQAKDCGKMLKKLLNYLAIIILRVHTRIENRLSLRLETKRSRPFSQKFETGN